MNKGEKHTFLPWITVSRPPISVGSERSLLLRPPPTLPSFMGSIHLMFWGNGLLLHPREGEGGMTFPNCTAVCLYVAPSVELLLFPQLEFLDQRDWSFTALPVFAQMESAAGAPALTSYNYSNTVLLSPQWDIRLSPSVYFSLIIVIPHVEMVVFTPLLYLLLHCAKL